MNTTDIIELYAYESPDPFATLYAASLTLSVDIRGAAWYQGPNGPSQVATVFADLDSSALTLTLTRQSGVAPLLLPYIGGTAFPYTPGTLVTAGVSWGLQSADLVVNFTTPLGAGDQFEWKWNDEAPPVQLKIKIRKQ